MQGHGTVYWNELMTRDVEASKAFHGPIMNWVFSEMPMSGGSYWLFMPEGSDKPAGGMMQFTDGPTDLWFTYVAVDDVDAAVAKVDAAGGAVVRPPFDVPGVGRIAIVKDTTGAVVGWMTPEAM